MNVVGTARTDPAPAPPFATIHTRHERALLAQAFSGRYERCSAHQPAGECDFCSYPLQLTSLRACPTPKATDVVWERHNDHTTHHSTYSLGTRSAFQLTMSPTSRLTGSGALLYSISIAHGRCFSARS
jgi:hypothetical protein